MAGAVVINSQPFSRWRCSQGRDRDPDTVWNFLCICGPFLVKYHSSFFLPKLTLNRKYHNTNYLLMTVGQMYMLIRQSAHCVYVNSSVDCVCVYLNSSVSWLCVYVYMSVSWLCVCVYVNLSVDCVCILFVYVNLSVSWLCVYVNLSVSRLTN